MVKIWNRKTGQPETVKAGIWLRESAGSSGYIYARAADGCMITVMPMRMIGNETEPDRIRTIIALNPNLPEAENLTLRPLAEILEQIEQIREEAEFRRIGIYRRDHSHARDNAGCLSLPPFEETSDPWFVSSAEDIIDSPRIGTLIPYDTVLSIINNSHAMVRKAGVVRYYSSGGQIIAKKGHDADAVSLGGLYSWAEHSLSELEATEELVHLFVRVAVDPDMLRHNNSLLAACCLNMVGKSDSAVSRSNLLEIDYRTCLYTDQSITILAAVDAGNHSLGSLIGEDIMDSRICTDLKNLLEQRQELKNIGSGLNEKIQTITMDTTENDRFNSRLVRLSTRIEEDGLITDPLESMVYRFIRTTMGIDTLKESVITSAELLIKNAEQQRDRDLKKAQQKQEEAQKLEDEASQRRDARIQAGIGWVTVLAVFSAWIDAYDFLGKLSPDMEDGWHSLMNYPPLFLFELLMAIAILLVGIIAVIYHFGKSTTPDQLDQTWVNCLNLFGVEYNA